MQPQAQDRALSREGGRRLARRSVHQEARAREDPAMVCLDDAKVDARTHSEVVPRDDEPLHERVPLAPAASSDRSAPAAGSARSARVMQTGFAQLTSPLDRWMYARYCSGVALTSQASRIFHPRGSRLVRQYS